MKNWLNQHYFTAWNRTTIVITNNMGSNTVPKLVTLKRNLQKLEFSCAKEFPRLSITNMCSFKTFLISLCYRNDLIVQPLPHLRFLTISRSKSKRRKTSSSCVLRYVFSRMLQRSIFCFTDTSWILSERILLVDYLKF